MNYILTYSAGYHWFSTCITFIYSRSHGKDLIVTWKRNIRTRAHTNNTYKFKWKKNPFISLFFSFYFSNFFKRKVTHFSRYFLKGIEVESMRQIYIYREQKLTENFAIIEKSSWKLLAFTNFPTTAGNRNFQPFFTILNCGNNEYETPIFCITFWGD